LRSLAREIPPPEWVVGLQFEDQKLEEPRLPTRRDLDAAVPDRPAIVVKADGHLLIANTQAISAAGVSASILAGGNEHEVRQRQGPVHLPGKVDDRTSSSMFFLTMS
jgi:predicted amidohydrolase YtcJ